MCGIRREKRYHSPPVKTTSDLLGVSSRLAYPSSHVYSSDTRGREKSPVKYRAWLQYCYLAMGQITSKMKHGILNIILNALDKNSDGLN